MKIDIASLRGLDAHRSADAELATRLEELNAEADGTAFNDEQRAEFAQIIEDRDTLAGVIEELETRATAVAAALGEDRKTEKAFTLPTVIRAAEDIHDISSYRKRASSIDELPKLLRDGAMRAVESFSSPLVSKAAAQEQLAKIIERHKDDKGAEAGKVSERVLATSSPAYVEAWAQQMKGLPVSQRMQAVMLTYTDDHGGAAIPVQIDPTFINVSDGTVNPIRDIARIETTNAKTWSAITTAGVTAAYAGERTTTGASDGAPTDVDDPTATPVRADVSVDVSLEYLQDYGAQALMGEVGNLIAAAKDDLEADKFLNGNGSGEPDGIVAAIITDTTSIVTTITDDTYALADIDKLIAAVPPRFRSRSTMLANQAILQASRAFATAAQPGLSIYDPLAKTLRGYPAREASEMDAAATNAKHILLMGDFRHFVVVDRLGLTTRVLDARDTNGRPTGNSTIYAAWRNTSKVLAFNAFRLLKVQ